MNILICMNPYPFFKAQGQTLRVYNIAKHLAKKHKLFLLGIHDDSLKLKDNSLIFNPENIFEKIYKVRIKRKRKKLIEIFNLIAPKYSTNLEFLKTKKDLYKFISQIVEKEKIDILHINGRPFVNILLADFKKVPKILDLCDSLSLYYKRGINSTSQFFKKFVLYSKYLWAKSIEKYLIKNYNIITFVSSIDANFSAKLEKGSFEIVPNGIDIEYFKPISSVKEDFPSVIFFGAMDFKPNIDAVLYFYKNIFPEIKNVFPEIKFYIVGRTPVKEIVELKKDKNVVVTGTVEDIRPFIMKASVVVVPIRMGSGMKNKILEAMALQKPIVCTSLAIEALDDRCKDVVLMGDTPKEFVNNVIYLLRNEEKRIELGYKARQIVKDIYSWEKSAEKYSKLYENLLITKNKNVS